MTIVIFFGLCLLLCSSQAWAQNPCDKCNVPVGAGGCKCNSACACISKCDMCNVSPSLGGYKCDSQCNPIQVNPCDKCNLPVTQGGCKCDAACNCKTVNPCDKCNLPVSQGGCMCDAACNCKAVNPCDKCNVPVSQGGCKCDGNCACLPPTTSCSGASLPPAPSNTAWNSCDGTLSGGVCTTRPCPAGSTGGFSTTCTAAGSWGPVTGSPCQAGPPPSSDFVRWDGSKFVVGGSTFVPVGFNAYWLGLTEEKNYPTKAQIEEAFSVAAKTGATVIRSHTLAVSFGSPNALRPGTGPDPNLLNSRAWDAIDYAFDTARKYKIKLIVPLLDAYEYFHGGYGSFCKSRGVPKGDFWTNQQVRSDFKDFISKWLTRVNAYNGIERRNDPALFMIELGNELGNIRSGDLAQSFTLPTREWIADITSYIKTLDKNHLVLSGSDECLGSATSDDFNVPQLDAFSAHFYGVDFNRISFGASNAARLRKPYLIGEYDHKFDDGWFARVESMKEIAGTVWWSLYYHVNGINGGAKVPHGDGYTLHYPEDMAQLNRLSAHYTRMKARSGVSARSPKAQQSWESTMVGAAAAAAPADGFSSIGSSGPDSDAAVQAASSLSGAAVTQVADSRDEAAGGDGIITVTGATASDDDVVGVPEQPSEAEAQQQVQAAPEQNPTPVESSDEGDIHP